MYFKTYQIYQTKIDDEIRYVYSISLKIEDTFSEGEETEICRHIREVKGSGGKLIAIIKACSEVKGKDETFFNKYLDELLANPEVVKDYLLNLSKQPSSLNQKV